MKLFGKNKTKKRKFKDNMITILDAYVDENKKLKEKLEIAEHNSLILLENSIEQRRKITDLENNIELLINNLSATKKKQINLEMEEN